MYTVNCSIQTGGEFGILINSGAISTTYRLLLPFYLTINEGEDEEDLVPFQRRAGELQHDGLRLAEEVRPVRHGEFALNGPGACTCCLPSSIPVHDVKLLSVFAPLPVTRPRNLKMIDDKK